MCFDHTRVLTERLFGTEHGQGQPAPNGNICKDKPWGRYGRAQQCGRLKLTPLCGVSKRHVPNFW
jgi:hypothetical protein